MKQKKIPMRMCVGCREMKPKKELIRVVRPPEGSVMLDRTGKAAGRGAYVCPSSACLEKARKAKTLERTLEAIGPLMESALGPPVAPLVTAPPQVVL